MDEVEWTLQRKGRSQTEGLGLFVVDMPSIGPRTGTAYPVAPHETSHPDSVAGNSQNGRILKHLQEVGPLTSLDALTLFGCARLAARIADLKNRGYTIRSRFVTVGANKKVSEYTLIV